MLKQISAVVENKPGTALEVMETLAVAGVNARSITISESDKYGIVRLIVDDTNRAEEALSGKFLAVRVADIVGISVPDKPGALMNAMRALSDNGVNIRYCYSLNAKTDGRADIAIRIKTAHIDKAVEVLMNAGARLLCTEDLI